MTQLGQLKALFADNTVPCYPVWQIVLDKWSIFKSTPVWWLIPPTKLQSEVSAYVCWGGFDEARALFKEATKS